MSTVVTVLAFVAAGTMLVVEVLRRLTSRATGSSARTTPIGWPELEPAEQYEIDRAIAHEVPTANPCCGRSVASGCPQRSGAYGAPVRARRATGDELRTRSTNLPR